MAWQRTQAVVKLVLRACRKHQRGYRWAVLNQLQRAALSVQLNIAEGYALGSARFRYHLTIAYGSAVETSELLELVRGEEILPPEACEQALDLAG